MVSVHYIISTFATQQEGLGSDPRPGPFSVGFACSPHEEVVKRKFPSNSDVAREWK